MKSLSENISLGKKEFIFMSSNDGKCSECDEKKPLDSMVLKYAREHPKNVYECIDCKIDFENFKEKDFEEYKEHKETLIQVLDDEYVTNSKMKNLIKWCFG